MSSRKRARDAHQPAGPVASSRSSSPSPSASASASASADDGTRPAGRRAFVRTNLPPAAGVGVLMGLVAAQEGGGAAVAVVVALAGCAVVLGLLLLKRALYGP